MLTASAAMPATWGKTMQPNNINRGAVADSDILRSVKLLKQRAPHFVRRPLFADSRIFRKFALSLPHELFKVVLSHSIRG